MIIKFFSRFYKTAKAVKKLWKDGGITKVNISQINYGKILKGKKILITGGSSGIGLAIAKKCLSEGATVVITGRNKEKLKSVKENLKTSNLITLDWDVSDLGILKDKFEELLEILDCRIDVLVNNAGILGGHGKFLDLTEQQWEKIISVNSKGLVFLTQKICKFWIENKLHGKIINMSSMRSILGVLDGPYGMSKWALNGLTKGLALDYAKYGIIINGIAPGIIDTKSIAIKNIDSSENAYLNYIPAKRIGLPEEVAEIALFLMSDAANYIVGHTINCDGGYTIKA